MAGLLRPNSVEGMLTVFLRDQAGKATIWGERDCGLWLADWISYYRGIEDPAAYLRTAYFNEKTCRAKLRGLPYPVLVSRLARKCGLRSTDNPSVGAIAIIIANDNIVGAIRTANGWAVVAAHGIIRLPENQRIVRAWEVRDAADNISNRS